MASQVQNGRGRWLLATILLFPAVPEAMARTPLPERRPDRWIYDAASVIDDAEERRLEQVNTELFSKTGVAIVVVTVPALVDETADELAVRVGESWGVGRKGQDRGLVVAFARDDRRIFVATGYGTESYLPDGRVGALLDQFAVPHLRASRFSEGLTQLDLALASVSAEEYGAQLTGATPVPAAPQRPQLGVRHVVIGILMIILFGYLAIRHPWLLMMMMMGGRGRHGGGFGGGGGHGGFGGGGFGGGGAGRGF